MSNFSIALHGGAGTISRDSLTPEIEQKYKKALQQALNIGKNILINKGTAIDAVTQTVVELENIDLFNAGKGAVFNSEGKFELDASLFCGKSMDGGAVAGVSHIKNPILLAKSVFENSPHVMMIGKGAEEFAKNQHIEMVDESYFFTQHRYNQWQEIKDTDNYQLDHSQPTNNKMGTVGAVALDIFGNLAAATSTGGMTNKKFGRVGDTPILGAGTYANNNTCAVSCTGHGEMFIRNLVAYDVHCLMEYKNLTLDQACHVVVMEKLVKIHGEGGLIAIDKFGNICLPFNSEGMYRASAKNNEIDFVEIF